MPADPRAGDGALRADGVIDAGLTGQDWIAEHAAARQATPARRRADRRPGLREAELRQRASGCWRCPRTRRSRRPQDLEGKTIATELVRVTEAYFERLGVERQRRVLVGRDRSEAAGARRRHRRGHRNRLVAARQPAARHRHGARVEHAAHRQSARRSATPGSGRRSRTSRSCCRPPSKRRAASGLMLNVRARRSRRACWRCCRRCSGRRSRR